MRVIHVDTGREMRGGQWQALRLHGGLIAAGIDSMLLAKAGCPLAGQAARAGLPWMALSPLRLATLARRADLVHAHDARAHTLAAALARCAIVVARRVAFPIGQGWLSRWKYRRASRYLAVSRHVALQLADGGVDESRIDVVYDGVPVPDHEAAGDRILTPWSEDPGKCMSLAVEAARMAGVALAASRDLEADLPTAGALVYLSTAEGLGSGILLAMAHGVPCVASRVGGIPELIEHGVTGLLTDNNPEAIAAALSKVDRRMGVAARLSVMNRFSIRHMGAATLESYGRV